MNRNVTPQQSQGQLNNVMQTRNRSEIRFSVDGKRKGQVTTIQPLSSIISEVKNSMHDHGIYTQVSSFLAYKHFNQRSGEVLSHLPDRLSNCDFFMLLDQRDSTYSPINVAKQILGAKARDNNKKIRLLNKKLTLPNNTSSMRQEIPSSITGKSYDVDSELPAKIPSAKPYITKYKTKKKNEADIYHQDMQGIEKDDFQAEDPLGPFAILGPSQSDVTKTLSTLTGPLKVPVISPSSTSADLNRQPLFARTVPTNAGDSLAIATYLKHIDVSFVGIIYQHDLWGLAFHDDLVKELNVRGIKLVSTAYTENSIERSVRHLASKNARYIVGILNPETWSQVFHYANSYGIIGKPGYTWIFTEGNIEFLTPNFAVDKKTREDLARALHGSMLISIELPQHKQFNQAMANFATNKTLQEEFIALHSEPEIFDGYEFPSPGNSLYYNTAYDAMIALGVTACDTPDLFTGEEFYENLVQVHFQGASGSISIDKESGTRLFNNTQYSVRNILLSKDRSTSENHFFTSDIVALISFQGIRDIKSLVFANNSTLPPDSLPPVFEEQNLIPLTARLVGLILAGIVIGTSTVFFTWTLRNRDASLIRSSQPIFLCQLCVGVIIMVMSIVPLGVQEPMSKQGLDTACMSIPWFLSMGLVISFAALFSRTWRLNQLLEEAKLMRRTSVTPQDAMKPVSILVFTELCILTGWTKVDPPSWNRLPMNYDFYDRPTESYGACSFSGHGMIGFLIPVLSIICLTMLIASYQSYKARILPREFGESFHFAHSMISLLYTVILSFPCLFLARGHPTANYLLCSLALFFICFSILLPTFLPKYFLSLNKNKLRNNTSALSRLSRCHSAKSSQGPDDVHQTSICFQSYHFQCSDKQNPHDLENQTSNCNGDSRRQSGDIYNMVLSAYKTKLEGEFVNNPDDNSIHSSKTLEETHNRYGMMRVYRSQKYYMQIGAGEDDACELETVRN